MAESHGCPKHLQTPGLYDVMKKHAVAQKLARKMSDTALSSILKNWGFKSKSLGTSRGWEAPQLPDLRRSIRDKFSAVEFDDRKEWIADGERAGEDPVAGADGTGTAQPAEENGEPDAADLALDEIVGRCEQEKHDLSEETVSPQPANARVHRKPANLVDPVTGITSPAAVSAFVRGASRQGL